ncbi:hypothetical protein B1R32_12228 [Abditibacterium utsteinense]|uniref:DUF5666 domain-containing protein n=1 Tax=Abditibacterium utsteinense TaxID=1960156 RepID=A0A2S8SPR5_9BACT|nr:DUF6263 family protein [Abditibacterium utsteinense]PQV62781.1 hypothetical protein B1R32_12228 [Abditibacterium utsteinense]
MRPLLFLVAFGAAVPALAQDEVAKPAQNVAVAPLPDAAPFLWRLKLHAGQRFLTTSNTSSQTSQQMPKMPGDKTAAPEKMESTSKTLTVVEQNVLSSDEKGARVEVVYREMTQTMKMQQGDKVLFDSASPTAATKGITDISKNIVGARVSYQLTPDGHISDVQGAKEYLERLGAGLETATAQNPEQQKMMREMLKAAISPEALEKSIGIAYKDMPAKAVAPGDTWKYASTIAMMGTKFTQNGQSTFVSRAGNVVTLAQKGDFATDAGAEFKIPLPMPRDPKTPAPITQLDLHGTSTGETLVDELSGMTLSSRTTQTIEGEIVINGLTGPGSVFSIPMKVTSETTTKTEEIKSAG